MTSLVNSNALQAVQAIPTSDIPATMASVTAAWTSLAVPIFLITVEVLSLAWLLLFVLITEAVTIRGADVALAKLRGYGRIRSVALAVSEPVTLLIAAFPLGALAGWGAALALARVLLVPGTPVALSGLGWAAAAGSTAGGFVAVVVAARRIVRQPVLNLWRRAGRRITDRGWVLDGILMTGAVAGIVQLELSGEVSSTRHSALSLLVPGLLGLAVAVVASRALPIACRAAASASRSGRRAGKRGGLAWFLALRHIGRRPGGARTTIMLATSFALATFALAAWSVGEVNYRRVASAQVGAPTVLTVTTSQGHNLSDLVTQADPSGHMASPVEEYGSNNVETLAVDPASWLSVTGLDAGAAGRAGSGARAGGGAGGAAGAETGLAGVLDPPAAPSLILTGDQVQVSATASGVKPADDDLTMDVVTATGEGTTPIDLGVIPDEGPFTATGQLATCPCRVVDFALVPAPSLSFGDALTGTITFASMAVHDNSGWRPVDAAFSALSRWRAAAGPPAMFDNLGKPIPLGVISLAGSALKWTFGVTLNSDAVLSSADHPESLPAIVAAKLADSGQFSVPGLDGTALAVTVVATEAAIPGAPANGVVVDQHFAELAADNNLDNVVQQVWLAKGATTTIVPRLEAEGVAIDSTADRVGALDRLHRQGPGLASVLFLAEGAAAAALAAGGAILGLYLSARRRRYEYAALTATGLSHRTLRRALAAEQIVVLAFGMVIGVATGLVAAAVALPAVPEFVTVPLAPALTHRPPAGEMA
ncbi:MAG: FtsX-like permease family protein, partial [Acidimicrobiales bacterium]